MDAASVSAPRRLCGKRHDPSVALVHPTRRLEHRGKRRGTTGGGRQRGHARRQDRGHPRCGAACGAKVHGTYGTPEAGTLTAWAQQRPRRDFSHAEKRNLSSKRENQGRQTGYARRQSLCGRASTHLRTFVFGLFWAPTTRRDRTEKSPSFCGEVGTEHARTLFNSLRGRRARLRCDRATED